MFAFIASHAVADLIGLLVHTNLGHFFVSVAQCLLERAVEFAQHGDPLPFATGDIVQLFFHLGREV